MVAKLDFTKQKGVSWFLKLGFHVYMYKHKSRILQDHENATIDSFSVSQIMEESAIHFSTGALHLNLPSVLYSFG